MKKICAALIILDFDLGLPVLKAKGSPILPRRRLNARQMPPYGRMFQDRLRRY